MVGGLEVLAVAVDQAELGLRQRLQAREVGIAVAPELADLLVQRLDPTVDAGNLLARLHLGVAEDQVGFLARVLPGLGHDPLGGEESVPQGLLHVPVLADLLVELDHLLAQLLVVGQDELVLVGDRRQEGLHLVGIETADGLAEFLLPDVQWRDSHRRLLNGFPSAGPGSLLPPHDEVAHPLEQHHDHEWTEIQSADRREHHSHGPQQRLGHIDEETPPTLVPVHRQPAQDHPDEDEE